MNITITFDITPRLFAAVKSIVDAERPRVPSIDVPDSEPETAVESTVPEKATEAQAEAEKPKKRQKRAATDAKDAEPVKTAAPAPAPAPAIGDNLSPAGEAELESKAAIEAPAPEPEPAPAPEPAPEKDMSGKGEKGEILSDLTRRALAELDEAGVARDESNRRIRDYGIRHGLKFPSFTALVQLLGYADAVAVAKGEIDD